MDISEHDDYLTDNGLCYAKVLLILRVTSIKLERNLELALVYWYDFAYPNNTTRHYFYKHAVLKHVEHYTLIPIASIANIAKKYNDTVKLCKGHFRSEFYSRLMRDNMRSIAKNNYYCKLVETLIQAEKESVTNIITRIKDYINMKVEAFQQKSEQELIQEMTLSIEEYEK
ncbi:12854_t:CDS:2 [Funneliformis geosporum]|nr:12854_t:CDS:2 [Funneliformis geosporum]